MGIVLLLKLLLRFFFHWILKGHTVHATIWKNLIDTYRAKINEGSIYAFSNFKVVDSTKYRPVSNEIKITFLYNTKLKEMKGSSDNFPDYYFEFASKDTLQERLEKDQQCSGMLTVIFLLPSGQFKFDVISWWLINKLKWITF